MKLLPALKQKKRYIVFETDNKSSKSDLQEAVNKAFLRFLGEFGVAKASPMFIKANNKRFIVKVNHTETNEAKAALILIKTIKKQPTIIKSIITSGTLKKAQSYL
jgi:RNase P/RNase MRP subunit POP5